MDFQEAAPRLLPVLRGVSAPGQAWLAAALDPERALIRQRFVPFLHALVAIDLDDRLVYVSRGDLASWQVGGDRIFDMARANLPPAAGLTRGSDGLWQLRAGDGYESSRLLLPRWLAAFESTVGGRPVAVVPHARYLAVGGEADIGALLLAGRVGFAEAGTPISPALYSVDREGGVVPYLPPPEHPMRIQAENAHKLLLHTEYDKQRQVLAEIDPAALFARTALLEQQETGRLISACAWTEGTEALLPLTDLVVLHPQQGEAVWAPRRLLDEVAPDSLQALENLEPPRHRARVWPDPGALERLRRGAVAVG